jgi:hypothetical protein
VKIALEFSRGSVYDFAFFTAVGYLNCERLFSVCESGDLW